MKYIDNDGRKHRLPVRYAVAALAIFAAGALADATATGQTNSPTVARRWDFNTWGDLEGWKVADIFDGKVIGGSLWLSVQRSDCKGEQIEWPKQMYAPKGHYDLTSPGGLNIPASKVTKLRMRLLNLSPETDGSFIWRTVESGNKDAGGLRFTMVPDLKEWQEVVCHVDGRWSGTIDQIRIEPARIRSRGDIWIDWIALTDGEPRPPQARPDVCSERVVPKVRIPGISQADFADAFKVLDECLITNVPVCGFPYPVMGPGGAYGENWWQLDSSLNVSGAKWANQQFAENVIRGFIAVQAVNPDGRIDLWGGTSIRGQVGDMSSIPTYLDIAYDVARRTNDRELREEILRSLRAYLDWWLSPVKQDTRCGLITAVAEETVTEPLRTTQTVAAVNLNVHVAVGCRNVSWLAEHLEHGEVAAKYRKEFTKLREAINRYMWNEERGVYYNYNVKENEQRPRLICSTFDPMRLNIAPPDRVERLIPKLLDPALFNWGKLPVTSLARTEPGYVEAEGPYDGRAWYGDVWTLCNMQIISGLNDVGRHDLAAELSWATIKGFNANYCEYLVPSNGSCQGVKRYGWSASQYIQSVVEYLFGVDYDRIEGRVRVVPHVPAELMGKEIALSNLILPVGDDTRLSATIKQSSPGKADIAITIDGTLPEGDFVILLPVCATGPKLVKNDQGTELPMIREFEGMRNVAGVRLPIQQSVSLHFE